jgi:hypothetical protein
MENAPGLFRLTGQVGHRAIHPHQFLEVALQRSQRKALRLLEGIGGHLRAL